MRRLTVLAGLTLLVARGAEAQRLARPTIDTVDHHIVRVMNNGPTAWADTNGWKLVYERTVQPKDGSAGELGEPSYATLLRDGRLLVTEEKPIALRLYDATGKYLRTLGREGAGPGEYKRPYAALYRDTLVFHDPQLSRGTVMTLDGKLIRSFTTVCCQFGLQASVDDRGRLRVFANATGPQGSHGQWVYLDLVGRRLDSLVAPRAVKQLVWEQKTANGSTTFYVPLAPQNHYAFLHNGSILYGGDNRYELLLSPNGRDTSRIFGRTDRKAIPVTNRVRDSLFHRIVDRNQRARDIAVLSDIPSTYPLWWTVDEDGNGNLWVFRSTGPGLPQRFDVFTPAGTLLGEVAVPFRKGYITSWTRDHLAVIDTDENDLPRIRIFRIDRRGH